MIFRLSGPRSTMSPIWTSRCVAAGPAALGIDHSGSAGDCPPGVMVAMQIADCDDALRRRLRDRRAGMSTAAITIRCQTQ